MAEGALGISTGQGQGEAQIIKPFQSPVTAQQYGSVMAAKQKAQQEAAAKKAKILANMETLDFKGRPIDAENFAKEYNEIWDFVATNLDDPLVEMKMKQKMSDLKTRAQMSVDLKENTQKLANTVQSKEGKNYFVGIDEAVQDAVAPVDYDTFKNTQKYGQLAAAKIAKLNSVKVVPMYDVGAAKAALQNQISGWAKDNMQGKSWQADDKIINSFVEAELIGHPEAIVHFEKVMKNDPIGAKAAGNDPYQYGFNELKKDLKAKGFTTGGNTNVNVSVGGDKDNSSVFASFSEQDIPMGVKAAEAEYPAPFKTQVIQLPSKGVDLGGGLVNTDMYMVDSNGETIQLKGQTAPTLSYTQVASLPIATKDTEVIDTKGNKFIIKKGQVVQPAYKSAAKSVNKVDIPTENKIMAIAVDDNGQTYYRPAQDVARAIVNTFSGQKGLTYKGKTVFKDISDFAAFMNDNGVQVQGFTPTVQPTTSGNNKTSIPAAQGGRRR